MEPSLALHVANRMGFGPRPGDLERMSRHSLEDWLENQMQPDEIPLPASLTSQLASYKTLSISPVKFIVDYAPQLRKLEKDKLTPAEQKAFVKSGRQSAIEAAEARLAHQLASPRQLQEALVEFWSNHFNIFVGKGLDRYFTAAYEREAIRPNTLGKFSDLLLATAKHPAMLFYLDNWQNTDPDSPGARGRYKGLNENYAREIMELHTLGVDGGYTQKDVEALTRILTGWTFAPSRRDFMRIKLAGLDPATIKDGFNFEENRHDGGEKILLGQRFGGGLEEGERALLMLARHPSTARHISFKLAQFFVEDVPDTKLVAAMSQRFMASDGDIKSVLREMFLSPRFVDAQVRQAKFKSPQRYVVSAIRATGIETKNILPVLGLLRQLGQFPFGCQSPDGYKCTQEAWLNPDAMTRRLSFAVALGGGHIAIQKEPARLDDFMADAARMEYGNGNMDFMRNADPVALDAEALLQTLGEQVSSKTRRVMTKAPAPLKAAVILGSPDMMMA